MISSHSKQMYIHSFVVVVTKLHKICHKEVATAQSIPYVAAITPRSSQRYAGIAVDQRTQLSIWTKTASVYCNLHHSTFIPEWSWALMVLTLFTSPILNQSVTGPAASATDNTNMCSSAALSPTLTFERCWQTYCSLTTYVALFIISRLQLLAKYMYIIFIISVFLSGFFSISLCLVSCSRLSCLHGYLSGCEQMLCSAQTLTCISKLQLRSEVSISIISVTAGPKPEHNAMLCITLLHPSICLSRACR